LRTCPGSWRWSTTFSTPGAAPDGTFGLINFRNFRSLNNNTVDGETTRRRFRRRTRAHATEYR
jgi:hypothetical protein